MPVLAVKCRVIVTGRSDVAGYTGAIVTKRENRA